MSSIAYIIVHGGAGVHGVHNEKEIKQALRKACVDGLSVFRHASASPQPSSSEQQQAIDECSPAFSNDNKKTDINLAMVVEAIAVLEDDGNLNAGYGSNLTMDGGVECDAAIMNGRDGSFGSVGAVSGVKNPICLAKSILDHSQLPHRFGRVPPLTLVSVGAHAFANQAQTESTIQNSGSRKVSTVPPETMISSSALEQWKKWKGRWESAAVAPEEENRVEDEQDMNDIQDTVGAVVFHPSEGVAAGVSSGGLLLKWPGRIGEAGIFGAGCWANAFGVGCSISGTGEDIVRENLARKLCDAFDPESDENDPHEILRVCLEDFWSTYIPTSLPASGLS